MMSAETRAPSMDPEDWDSLRELGHRMLDDMFDFQRSQSDGPVWRPMPREVRNRFEAPVPESSRSAEEIYEDFRENILPYALGNTHARFWAWVMGNGTPLGMLADMLASGLNPNMGGGSHAPELVELQVMEWCRELFDMPAGTSGLLTSGGSVANLVGLAVARHSGADFEIRQKGLFAAGAPMTVYGSVEMHSSVDKAIELLGIGSENLRKIPVDERFRIDTQALRERIESDLAEGLRPISIVGNAGATNTGALDPLDELADIAQEYNLWYHIDGAFGALAYLSPELRPLLEGLPRADSLAFDLHKWVYLPFEIGGTLVRDEEVHRRTFALRPDYLNAGTRGIAGGERWLSDYGIQLSRRFRALKAWMAFQVHGVDQIGEAVFVNVQQAEYLAQLVEEAEHLELLAPVDLNVVCFQYAPSDLEEHEINSLNEEILYRLQESGVAAPSGTYVNGRYAIRCAITNHRSQQDDFETLVDSVESIGQEILAHNGSVL